MMGLESGTVHGGEDDAPPKNLRCLCGREDALGELIEGGLLGETVCSFLDGRVVGNHRELEDGAQIGGISEDRSDAAIVHLEKLFENEDGDELGLGELVRALLRAVRRNGLLGDGVGDPCDRLRGFRGFWLMCGHMPPV